MSSRSVGPRIVFVLDVSGSMSGMKCQTLQLSVIRYIEDIPEGYCVGIVLFDDRYWTEQPLIQITSRSVRDAIVRKVPQMASGSTDIGGGILEGLSALRRTGLNINGSTMILVTDGGHCVGPPDYVGAVLPQLLSDKVKVICIAIGVSADPNLERLSNATKGHTYVASDSNREMAARVIESAIREVKTSKEMAESVTISVCNELIAINSQSNELQVVIDSDIGQNTVFTIGSEDIDKFSVSIQSPKGLIYDSTSEELNKNLSLKRYQLKPMTTDSGVWIIRFITHTNQTLSANVLVLSQPKSSNAIEMKVSLKEADSNSPPIIVAELRKGSDAVIGAEVTATVDRPNDTQSTVKLINYNNIYCNYFTDYCGSGRYNVSVSAKSDANNCKLKSITQTNRFSARTAEHFQRQQIVGCFKIQSLMPSKPSSDQKLQELSLSQEFTSFSVNCGQTSAAIEAPLPRTVRAPVLPPSRANRVNQTNVGIKGQKDKLFEEYFLVKKSINSSKLSDLEKKSLKDSMEAINGFITSTKNTTSDEINGFLNKLDEIKDKII